MKRVFKAKYGRFALPSGMFTVTAGFLIGMNALFPETVRSSAPEERIDEFYIISASPDGEKIAGVGTPLLIRIWDAETGETLVDLSTDTEIPLPLSIAWSPDSSRIAAAGGDTSIRVWCVDALEAYQCLAGEHSVELSGHEAPITTIAWSNDNRLASGSQVEPLSLRLWDMATYEPIPTTFNAGDTRQLAWHPTENLLAQAGTNGGLYVLPGDLSLRTRDAASYHIGAERAALVVAWSPSGDHLVYSDSTSQIHVIAADTHHEMLLLQASGRIFALAWSPDGNLLASSSDNGILATWNVENAMSFSATEVLSVQKTIAATLGIAWTERGDLLFPGNHELIAGSSVPFDTDLQ